MVKSTGLEGVALDLYWVQDGDTIAVCEFLLSEDCGARSEWVAHSAIERIGVEWTMVEGQCRWILVICISSMTCMNGIACVGYLREVK